MTKKTDYEHWLDEDAERVNTGSDIAHKLGIVVDVKEEAPQLNPNGSLAELTVNELLLYCGALLEGGHPLAQAIKLGTVQAGSEVTINVDRPTDYYSQNISTARNYVLSEKLKYEQSNVLNSVGIVFRRVVPKDQTKPWQQDGKTLIVSNEGNVPIKIFIEEVMS